MSSIIGNLKPIDDKSLGKYKSLINVLERSEDEILRVDVSNKDKTILVADFYKKQDIIDSFLIGYANGKPNELDLVDRFNAYKIYSNLPESEVTRYLIYSVFYMNTLKIGSDPDKVDISIRSINDVNIRIWK